MVRRRLPALREEQRQRLERIEAAPAPHQLVDDDWVDRGEAMLEPAGGVEPSAPVVEPAAPPRFVTPPKRLSPKKTEKPHGDSRWVNRPREGFTAAMEADAGEMSATKQGRSIKGLSAVGDWGWKERREGV